MAESGDSDSVGDWTIITDKLDENQISSQNETVTRMDDASCPDTNNMENTDKSSISNEEEQFVPIEDKPLNNSESFNYDGDDNLSYPDISSGSSKSYSFDSYELYRESSPSSISATSDSSFSIIDQPCAVCPLTPDILEGINEDMIDLSVVSSIQEELPPDIDLKPGRRHYVHTRNIHLNRWLNLIALLSAALVFGLGIGNFIGMSRQWWHEREIARRQVLKLKQLQDELVLCIKEKIEIDQKLMNLHKEFSNNGLYSYPGINEQINSSMQFDIKRNKDINQHLQKENIFQAQEVKIYQLQEENHELRDTLHCLTSQIESRWSSRTDENRKDELKVVSINEKINNVKDHINQMISENEELKTAVARLRYGNPLIQIESNTTFYNDNNNNNDLQNNTQNNTFTIVYNYWKEKFPTLTYDFNWVESYLRHDNQDTKSFNTAINDVLSSLFNQVNFLTEDIYNKFNIQEIRMNVKNKLAELENFSSSFCGTDCSHAINKTTKKMKEMIYIAIQKCKKAIQKFKDNEKPYEFKTKKLYSKISEIFKKLDQKWSDIKEHWSKKNRKEEKIHKYKKDKYSYHSKTDYKFKEKSKETNFVPRTYVEKYSNVKRINGRGM
ncbi:putative histone-lysine N-methyltransferase 1 isoform X1 [Centruroides sculpturatus]|uniref:putative histone-lysine N-methyltransferase 1 isoform X1 n=2 Tax=Centruroides sculpturatus TaxID=218467 RepID=UPI000C6DD596|nr:putative histone-lysine N-methyltransferase 1 isoform X1 [Centruroides sculpturatus]